MSTYPIDDNVVYDDTEQVPDNEVDGPERDGEYELDDEYVPERDFLDWNQNEDLGDEDFNWEEVDTTPPIESSELLEANKEAMLSWVAPTEIVRTPLPDDPDQAAKISDRQIRALRRRGVFATAGASTSGVSVTKDSDPSPQHLDKGKGKEEDLFDVPLHEHPLTTEEEEGLNSLTSRQTQYLIEKYRAQIVAESRPGHRAEYDTELAAKEKEIVALKNERTTERIDHLAAIQASYSSGESKGRSEVVSQMGTLQRDLVAKDQRITHLENQLATQQRDHLAAIRDQEFSKLTEAMSTLKIREDPALELANSKVEKLRQMLADRKTTTRRLRDDLASHKNLLKSSQADLQNLQAARAEEQADDLARRQAASVQEGVRKANSERMSEQLEKSVAVATRAAEDERRAQEVISGLRRDLEASNAELARREKASKETTLENDNLQSRMGQLEDENRLLFHTQRVLEGQLEKEHDLRRDNSVLFDQMWEAQEETRGVMKDLERVRGQWESSKAAVGRLGNEVAEHRGLAEREAAKVRELEERWENEQAAAPPSETAVVEEAENGEREMNAHLRRSEKANEGFLRSLFPAGRISSFSCWGVWRLWCWWST